MMGSDGVVVDLSWGDVSWGNVVGVVLWILGGLISCDVDCVWCVEECVVVV